MTFSAATFRDNCGSAQGLMCGGLLDSPLENKYSGGISKDQGQNKGEPED